MRKSFLRHCIHPDILKTSIKTGLLVGVILAFINHFEGILKLDLPATELLQIAITFLVPFSVATYAAARHAQRLEELEEKYHHSKK